MEKKKAHTGKQPTTRKPTGVRMSHMRFTQIVTALKKIESSTGKSHDRTMRLNTLRLLASDSHPHWSHGTQLLTIQLRFSTQILSGVSGTITSVIPIDLFEYPDYADIGQLFDEYRILRANVHYVPRCRNAYDSSTTGSVPGNLVIYVDYDESSASSGYELAWQHDTTHAICTNQDQHVKVKPMGQPDLAWKNTAITTTASAWVKFYASSLSISNLYGRAFVTLDVQLRSVQ